MIDGLEVRCIKNPESDIKRIRCNDAADVCSWTGPRSLFDRHVQQHIKDKEDIVSIISCQWKCFGCSWTGKADESGVHVAQSCKFTHVLCPLHMFGCVHSCARHELLCHINENALVHLELISAFASASMAGVLTALQDRNHLQRSAIDVDVTEEFYIHKDMLLKLNADVRTIIQTSTYSIVDEPHRLEVGSSTSAFSIWLV